MLRRNYIRALAVVGFVGFDIPMFFHEGESYPTDEISPHDEWSKVRTHTSFTQVQATVVV